MSNHVPDGTFKRLSWGVLVLAILFASAKIIEGMIVALVVVVGVFVTVSAIKPLAAWTFGGKDAKKGMGYYTMIIVTAVIVHGVVGAGTLGGIIATAFALLFKMILLDAIIDARNGKRGINPFGDDFNPLGWLLCGAGRRDADVVAFA